MCFYFLQVNESFDYLRSTKSRLRPYFMNLKNRVQTAKKKICQIYIQKINQISHPETIHPRNTNWFKLWDMVEEEA